MDWISMPWNRTTWIALAACILLGCGREEQVEPRASIQVATTPSGAGISCDGAKYGSAPVSIGDLSAGEHLLVADYKGYRTARQSVTLGSGQETTVELDLEPIAGLVLIHSQPSGAEVEMDGEYKGVTPLFLTDVALGTRPVRLSGPGIVPATVTVDVQGRKPAFIEVELQPDTGQLMVGGEPAGAVVLLDGMPRGELPLDLTAVPSGEYQLRVTAEGYQDYVEDVTLQAGEVREVAVALALHEGKVKITSVPSRARVYIDGRFRGETPALVEHIAPGPHALKLEKEGHELVEQEVLAPETGTADINVELTASTGRFVVRTQPSGVRVYLDGEYKGTTPGGTVMDLSEGLEINLVVPGSHTLRFSKDGYLRISTEAVAEQGEVTEVSQELVQLFVPDTEVRTLRGTVRTGVLVSKTPEGDVQLEVSRGLTVDIKADEIEEIRTLPQE